jgi:hypothetical protein
MLQVDAGAGVGLARVVMPQKQNKAAWNRDNRQKKRAGNVSDDKAEPALLGVECTQRSAKKAETKGRAPSAAKAGHTAVWAGAKAKAIEEIDSEESDDERAQARMGANHAGKTPKKSEDQEAGIDARERVGRKTARATSAMRTAQRLHQRQRDAGDDASGNFAEEGEFARRLRQEVNFPRMATLPRKASLPKTAILPRRATLLRRAALLQPSKMDQR